MAEETHSQETEETRNRRKVRVGVVSSDKMQKTVVVTIKNLVRHPVYGRYSETRQKVQGA